MYGTNCSHKKNGNCSYDHTKGLSKEPQQNTCSSNLRNKLNPAIDFISKQEDLNKGVSEKFDQEMNNLKRKF